MGLLGPDDPAPVIAENPGAASPFVLVCDHAGRAVPAGLARLGLSGEVFDTHIAWDIGALDVGRKLATALNAPLIHQAYSRLVIDCNRDPARPDSIVTVSDGRDVPGNVGLSASQVGARRIEIFDPYHARIAAEVDAREGRGLSTLLICLHSFTPAMNGEDRPWHVGVLHLGNSRASTLMLDLLRRIPGLVVGDNQPYAMDTVDFTAPFHAHLRGLDAVELEIRQDLIDSPEGVARYTDLFADLLPRLVAVRGLARPPGNSRV